MTTQLITAVIVSITSAAVLALVRLLTGRAQRVWRARRSGAGARRVWLPYLPVLLVGAAVGYGVGSQIETEEAGGRIVSPKSGRSVAPGSVVVSGTLRAVPEHRHVWIAVQRDNSLFPKGEIGARDARWTKTVTEAGPAHGFALVLLMVDADGHRAIERWLAQGTRTGSFPEFTRPPGSRQLDSVDVVQSKAPPAVTKPAGLILSPRSGATVPAGPLAVRGRLAGIPRGRHVWIAVMRGGGLFPKEPEIPSSISRWARRVDEAGSPHDFSLALLMVGRRGHHDIVRWLERGRRSGNFPALGTIRASRRLDAVLVHQR